MEMTTNKMTTTTTTAFTTLSLGGVHVCLHPSHAAASGVSDAGACPSASAAAGGGTNTISVKKQKDGSVVLELSSFSGSLVVSQEGDLHALQALATSATATATATATKSTDASVDDVPQDVDLSNNDDTTSIVNTKSGGDGKQDEDDSFLVVRDRKRTRKEYSAENRRLTMDNEDNDDIQLPTNQKECTNKTEKECIDTKLSYVSSEVVDDLQKEVQDLKSTNRHLEIVNDLHNRLEKAYKRKMDRQIVQIQEKDQQIQNLVAYKNGLEESVRNCRNVFHGIISILRFNSTDSNRIHDIFNLLINRGVVNLDDTQNMNFYGLVPP